MKQIQHHQSGFTIVELMIATVVSSLILVVITFGIVHFTNDYYKGVNTSSTQTVTQNAIDAVAQSIQFNATGTVATNGTEGIFCAGNQLFMYTRGKTLSGTPTTGNWGLYQLNNPSANCNPLAPPASNGGTELLGPNMRLADINLSKVGATDVWQLDIRIAYGDPDLLCNSGITSATTKGSCDKGAPSYTTSDLIQGSDVRCKIQVGSQFCSVVHLTTAIGQRVNN